MGKRVRITIYRKNIMFWGPTKDGVIFGVCLKGVGDIHLICMDDGDYVSKHITDKTYSPTKYTTLGKTPKAQYDELVKHHHRKWIRKYHGNQKCWAASKKLLSRINEEFYNIANDRQIPYELLYGHIVLDIDNPERWNRIKIRELVCDRRFAVINDDGIFRIIKPIDTQMMFCYSDRQFRNFSNKLIQLYGYEEYLDYLIEKFGQDTLERMVAQKLGFNESSSQQTM